MNPGAKRKLEDLRRWRAGPARDVSLARPLAAFVSEVRGRGRRTSAIDAAWAQAVPESLRSGVTSVVFSGTTLKLHVVDAGVRFEVDRFLRSTGLAAIRSISGIEVRDVRFVR